MIRRGGGSSFYPEESGTREKHGSRLLKTSVELEEKILR